MNLAEALIAEFDHEATATRRTLERIPPDALDWRPHPKSMTMRALASHIAEMPVWTKTTMETSELDFAQVEYKPFSGDSVEAVVARYEESVKTAIGALQGRPDSDFMVPWTLRKGDHVMFTLPKVAVLRSMILNHQVHHRAQLGLYLRLNDIPVPGIYGPSADEA